MTLGAWARAKLELEFSWGTKKNNFEKILGETKIFRPIHEIQQSLQLKKNREMCYKTPTLCLQV